jgi:hypothetical protein
MSQTAYGGVSAHADELAKTPPDRGDVVHSRLLFPLAAFDGSKLLCQMAFRGAERHRPPAVRTKL